MYMHVEHCEERVRVAFSPVAFDRRPYEWLGEDEVGEVVNRKQLCIVAEELIEKSLGREEVNVCVGIEELEINVDETLLAYR